MGKFHPEYSHGLRQINIGYPVFCCGNAVVDAAMDFVALYKPLPKYTNKYINQHHIYNIKQ